MSAEYALAHAVNGNGNGNNNQSQEKTREQNAALNGHDADIQSETHSFTSTGTFTTPTQESRPPFSSHPSSSAALPQSHIATTTADTQSLVSTTDAFSEAPEQPRSATPIAPSSSLPPPGQHAGVPVAKNDSSAGLLPSTISHWAPEKDSSIIPVDEVIPGGTTPAALDEAQSAKDPWMTPKKASDLAAETPSSDPEAASSKASDLAAEAPSSAPEGISSTDPETIPDMTSGATASMKPEAMPGSSPKIAPYSAPEEKATGDQESPTSSNMDKDIDLEAGHRSEDSDKKEPETTHTEVDPNIVDWDGPEDPKNPVNWSEKLKWANVGVIASITFLTPLASSMLAPAVPEVMTEFKSSNEELASFVVSVYVLGYATGPLVIAPLSELYGRVPVYHVCNVLFIVFTIACAVSSNLNMLIAWRFFQGTFGSCPLTIGGGTISDMIVQQKRGGVMSIWALGPLLGPVIGPVAGGYLAQAEGWRWIFWVLALAAGVITIIAFFSLRESYPPVLLERKAKKLRKDTGNEQLRSKLASPLTPAALFRISIFRPLKLLLFSPIVLALSTYMAVVYGYLYLLFTTITEVYEDRYGFSQGSVGLTYLGIGVGSVLGVVIFGLFSDRILKAKSKSGEMKAEYRLPPMIPGSFFIPIGLFLYGWTADKHVFWFVPILGTGMVGFGLLATFMPISLYLVDAFTIYAASALAANTVLRSLLGAMLPLAGQKMYATLGLGWGNSLLAFIAVAMIPIPIIFYNYGERIRKNPRFQVKLK